MDIDISDSQVAVGALAALVPLVPLVGSLSRTAWRRTRRPGPVGVRTVAPAVTRVEIVVRVELVSDTDR